MESKIRNKIIKRFYPEHEVFGAYDAGEKYIFMIREKGVSGGILDPFYSIDKTTLEIKGFVPHENLKLFNFARQHPVKW